MLVSSIVKTAAAARGIFFFAIWIIANNRGDFNKKWERFGLFQPKWLNPVRIVKKEGNRNAQKRLTREDRKMYNLDCRKMQGSNQERQIIGQKRDQNALKRTKKSGVAYGLS
jgi:hypothetical protein